MTDMHEAENLEASYGPLYRFSDSKPGARIRFRDPQQGELSGVILWVVGPGSIAGRQVAAHYIVEPDQGGFPETVHFNDVIAENSHRQDEPTLQHCPYCRGMHEANKIEQCPLNPHRNSEHHGNI